jgi:hypothetical protein
MKLRRIDFEGLDPITSLSYLVQILGGKYYRIGFVEDTNVVKYVDIKPEQPVDEEWVDRLERLKAKLKENGPHKQSQS